MIGTSKLRQVVLDMIREGSLDDSHATTFLSVADQIDKDVSSVTNQLKTLEKYKSDLNNVCQVLGMSDGTGVPRSWDDISSELERRFSESRVVLQWIKENGGFEKVSNRDWFANQAACAIAGEDEGVKDANWLLSELDRRLMPSDYEWPKYENGEKISDGSPVEKDGKLGTVLGVLVLNHRFVLFCKSDEKGEDNLRFEYLSGEGVKTPNPDPVGFDGLPIHKDEIVYGVRNGKKYYVLQVNPPVPDDSFQSCNLKLTYRAKHGVNICTYGKSEWFIHKKPELEDSWDLIDKDCELDSDKYVLARMDSCVDCSDPEIAKVRDIVRRTKELAAKEASC